jgi:hypothetical protein
MKRLIFIAAILMVGCISTRVTPLGESKKFEPRTPWALIEVYLEKPDKPFVEIALVECEGAALSSGGQALEAIKEKASDLGGDAIVFQPTKRELANTLTGFTTVKKTNRVVIRFLDDRTNRIPRDSTGAVLPH